MVSPKRKANDSLDAFRARRAAEKAAGSPDHDVPTEQRPRHCWVVDPPGYLGRWAGVVLQWRRGEAGWEGSVVYGVTTLKGDPAVVRGWLPAEHLKPAGTDDTDRSTT